MCYSILSHTKAIILCNIYVLCIFLLPHVEILGDLKIFSYFNTLQLCVHERHFMSCNPKELDALSIYWDYLLRFMC